MASFSKRIKGFGVLLCFFGAFSWILFSVFAPALSYAGMLPKVTLRF